VPEGHAIHRHARDHDGWFAGQTVAVSSPQGRFAAGAGVLDGRRFESAEAWGKHLFHRYEGGATVHIHLGLYGKVFPQVLRDGRAPTDPRDTVRYRVHGAARVIDLIGAAACELVDPPAFEAILARLGPDPIRSDADPDRAWATLQRRAVPIGRALMDQTVLAGVGNIYRAEILFVHGLHPLVASRAVPRETFDAMWATLVTWMRRGVRERMIVTVDPDEFGMARRDITRETSTYVYHQDRCRRCARPVRRWDLAGRWAYACERCQPLPEGAR
jgi:endonuclease VIII